MNTHSTATSTGSGSTRRRAGFAGAAALAAVATQVAPAAAHTDSPFAPTGTIDAAVDHFRSEMRKLWEDHVTWTRLAIISVAAGSSDLGPTVDRLMRNQDDIGNALKPIYGDAAGTKLTTLLKEHIAIAADLLVAAKTGDDAAADKAKAAWYANADDIAVFLDAANHDNWPLEAAKTLMRGHLDHTLDEAVARFTGDWAADIAAYDRVHEHILLMSDALTMGIVAQFPEKFVSLAAEQVRVPDLMGLDERSALARIEAAGLTPTLANRQTANDVAPEARDFVRSMTPGRVLSQLPVPGTPAWKGSPVLLAVKAA
jgi:hypothetical protein